MTCTGSLWLPALVRHQLDPPEPCRGCQRAVMPCPTCAMSSSGVTVSTSNAEIVTSRMRMGPPCGQSRKGSNSSAAAIATPIGSSTCMTRMVPSW